MASYVASYWDILHDRSYYSQLTKIAFSVAMLVVGDLSLHPSSFLQAKRAFVTPLTSIDGTELTNSGKDMPIQALPGL